MSRIALSALMAAAFIVPAALAEPPKHAASADVAVEPTPPNTLSEQEKEAGWVLLFDGKTSAGWRQLGGDKFPAENWTVKDGLLIHEPVKAHGHDIIYEKKVENFELTWEWVVPKENGNSGIKYRVQETKGNGGAFGPEYQMMNDPKATDKHATASLYDVLPPTGKKLAPDGQFNRSRVLVQGNHVEHWLNGVKTVEFEFGSETLEKAVAQSKFKGKDWGRKATGFIALTDHGDEAHFRSIKLRELK